MLPKPSVCLNIPKTGTAFTRRFLETADLLSFARWCGVSRHVVPGRNGMALSRYLKRHWVACGSLNCRLPGHHTDYAELPGALRGLPKICALRDTLGWYRSYCVYYTHSMPGNLLCRAIRLLADGVDRDLDPITRTVLLRHREAFLARFDGEEATADAPQGVSVEFLLWFTQTVRLERMMRERTGLETWPPQVGFLTYRAISMLFEDPGRVFALDAGSFEAYFSSGRYLQDLRCDYLLDFDQLTEELCVLMVRELGYDPNIVAWLAESVAPQNVSPSATGRRAGRALAHGNLLRRIRAQEAIYETYLLPLAGAWRGDGTGRAAIGAGRSGTRGEAARKP